MDHLEEIIRIAKEVEQLCKDSGVDADDIEGVCVMFVLKHRQEFLDWLEANRGNQKGPT